MTMALTYDDLEKMKLGEQAKIDMAANQKIDNDLSQQELDLAKQEQDSSQQLDQSMTEDAMNAIQKMDELDKAGQDHMTYFNNLPPAIQDKVSEILLGSMDSEQTQKQQNFQPIQPQQEQQQQDLTGQAKQIAQLG